MSLRGTKVRSRLSIITQLGLVTLGVTVGALIQYTVDHDPAGNLLAFLRWVYDLAKDWQTLIAGLVAIAAAWWTYRAAQRQIDTNRRAEMRRESRERRAAKLMLPMALSALCDYAERSAAVFAKGTPFSSSDIPTFPNATLAPLQACLRFEKGNNAAKIIELTEWIQVYESRLDTAKSSVPTIIGYAQLIVDVARLHKLSEDLFEYARQGELKANTPPVSSKAVDHVLRLGGVYRLHEGLMKRINALLDAQKKQHGKPAEEAAEDSAEGHDAD